jgi:hypothetical protein
MHASLLRRTTAAAAAVPAARLRGDGPAHACTVGAPQVTMGTCQRRCRRMSRAQRSCRCPLTSWAATVSVCGVWSCGSSGAATTGAPIVTARTLIAAAAGHARVCWQRRPESSQVSCVLTHTRDCTRTCSLARCLPAHRQRLGSDAAGAAAAAAGGAHQEPALPGPRRRGEAGTTGAEGRLGAMRAGCLLRPHCVRACVRACACVRVCVRVCMCAHAGACSCLGSVPATLFSAHALRTPLPTRPHTHTHTHTHTQTHTHARTQMRTHRRSWRR